MTSFIHFCHFIANFRLVMLGQLENYHGAVLNWQFYVSGWLLQHLVQVFSSGILFMSNTLHCPNFDTGCFSVWNTLENQWPKYKAVEQIITEELIMHSVWFVQLLHYFLFFLFLFFFIFIHWQLCSLISLTDCDWSLIFGCNSITIQGVTLFFLAILIEI